MTAYPIVEIFFEEETFTASYLIYDQVGGRSAVLDVVLNYDQGHARTSTTSADEIIARIHELKLTNLYILDSHAHADHVSAAAYMKAELGGTTAIGEMITHTQGIFKGIYNLDDSFKADGSQFDQLLSDGDSFTVGTLTFAVMHTPGHTPACVTYLVGDCAFVGDTLFQPDFGTARCDFPGGDAATLYHSVQKILALPAQTRLFTGHDYAPNGRDFEFETTVAKQRGGNIHISEGVTEETFVAMRESRDKTLSAPRLLLPSIQINIRAGNFPEAEANGQQYLKLPFNFL